MLVCTFLNSIIGTIENTEEDEMIYYYSDDQVFLDEDDDMFFVEMSTDSYDEQYLEELEFNNQTEFWDWYNKGPEDC